LSGNQLLLKKYSIYGNRFPSGVELFSQHVDFAKMRI